jgi:cytochrome c-type biogenesis protein CcsB
MSLYTLLLTATAVSYFTAAVCYWRFLLKFSDKANRVAGFTLTAGFLLHTCANIYVAPFASLLGALLLITWASVGLYLLMSQRHQIEVLGAVVSPFVLVVAIIARAFPQATLSSVWEVGWEVGWSVLHITASLFSYAGFSLAFIAGLVYIFQERMLKAKRVTALLNRLPSLDVMDRFAYHMVTIGFFLLTVGIISGSMWASTAWGRFWSWSGKETWSLITWLVYAAYLHVRGIAGWHGRWANRLLIIGFACILITFFGTSFITPGFHGSCQ